MTETIHQWTCTGDPKHELTISDDGRPDGPVRTAIEFANRECCKGCSAKLSNGQICGHRVVYVAEKKG